MDPFEELDRRLTETRERVRWFDHLAARHTTIGQQIREVGDLVAQLERKLAEERRDVERLEGGLSGFLARLAGSREERLAKERAEAVLAGERLDGQRARLDALKADLAATERDLAASAGSHEDYQQLLSEKELLLVEGGDQRGQRLMELSGRLADTRADLREHDEAVQAGKEAGQWVGHVLHLLGQAHGASTWDLLGGGAFADAVERHHLVSADQAAWKAQKALDTFSRELADLGWTASPRMPEIDTAGSSTSSSTTSSSTRSSTGASTRPAPPWRRCTAGSTTRSRPSPGTRPSCRSASRTSPPNANNFSRPDRCHGIAGRLMTIRLPPAPRS